MKYTVFISFFAGCTAFAPITRKTSAATCSSFAAPKKYDAVGFVPAVVHKVSSTALNVENNIDILALVGAVLTVSTFVKSLTDDIKSNIKELKAELKEDYKELKTASKENFNELKTEFQGLKTDVQGLKADLSADVEKKITASEKNFKDLKTDVVFEDWLF
jgi:predicted nuclease with TOPRIM domain